MSKNIFKKRASCGMTIRACLGMQLWYQAGGYMLE